MGLYSRQSGIMTESCKLNEENFIESTFEQPIEGAYNIVIESELNYNKMMQAIGIKELTVLESTGAEMVYEAADGKGFIATAKKFFTNIWQKIVGLFKKFFAIIDSKTKDDKAFLKKYDKQLQTAASKLKDFEFQGYKFSVEVESMQIDKADNKMKTEIKTLASNIDKDNLKTTTDEKTLDNVIQNLGSDNDPDDKIRGAVFGKSSLDANEFKEEMFKALRSGQDTKETIDNISINDYMKEISNTETLKKQANTQYNNTKKIVEQEIRDLNNLEKELFNVDEKNYPTDSDGNPSIIIHSKQITALSSIIAKDKFRVELLTAINGAFLQALKDRNSQARSVCVKAMSYKHEAVEFIGNTLEESTTDFWNGIELR